VTNQAIADWPPGAALWLVWQMTDPAGKGPAIAIDVLTFSASLWSTGLASPPLTALASGTGFKHLAIKAMSGAILQTIIARLTQEIYLAH
jgi:hypothetical protein